MNVIGFIIGNWDFILLIGAAVAALAAAIFFGNKAVIMRMLYALVTEAEKEYGGGTGSLKLADVISKIYPKLPGIIKAFITDKMLVSWIEDALAAAKEQWTANAAISGYIGVRE